jgi:hypothetical protein
MNKHLIKIVNDYIKYDLPYTSELINKTYNLRLDSMFYYNYENYATKIRGKRKGKSYKHWVYSRTYDGKWTYTYKDN